MQLLFTLSRSGEAGRRVLQVDYRDAAGEPLPDDSAEGHGAKLALLINFQSIMWPGVGWAVSLPACRSLWWALRGELRTLFDIDGVPREKRADAVDDMLRAGRKLVGGEHVLFVDKT